MELQDPHVLGCHIAPTFHFAGCLSVFYGTGLEMLYAGMNRNYWKITAQDLVYVTQMTQAFSQGARYCCIGGIDNTLEDGLLEFKSHFRCTIIEKVGEFDYLIPR